MPSTYKKLNDKWFRFLGVPLIAFMSHDVFFNEHHMREEGFTYWETYLIALAETVFVWETNRLVLQYFHNRYPALAQTRQRLIGVFIGCMVVTIIVRYLTIWFYDKTLFWGY